MDSGLPADVSSSLFTPSGKDQCCGGCGDHQSQWGCIHSFDLELLSPETQNPSSLHGIGAPDRCQIKEDPVVKREVLRDVSNATKRTHPVAEVSSFSSKMIKLEEIKEEIKVEQEIFVALAAAGDDDDEIQIVHEVQRPKTPANQETLSSSPLKKSISCPEDRENSLTLVLPVRSMSSPNPNYAKYFPIQHYKKGKKLGEGGFGSVKQ